MLPNQLSGPQQMYSSHAQRSKGYTHFAHDLLRKEALHLTPSAYFLQALGVPGIHLRLHPANTGGVTKPLSPSFFTAVWGYKELFCTCATTVDRFAGVYLGQAVGADHRAGRRHGRLPPHRVHGVEEAAHPAARGDHGLTRTTIPTPVEGKIVKNSSEPSSLPFLTLEWTSMILESPKATPGLHSLCPHWCSE